MTDGHWNDVYETNDASAVSWFEPEPTQSLAILARRGLLSCRSLIDIGGGASLLVDRLLDMGWSDLAVLDLSDAGLAVARSRLGERAKGIDWIVADVTRWTPRRTYDVWHDRAVFHFLTDPAAQDAYSNALAAALSDDGLAIVATFAPDGPSRCSGLPVARYDAEQLAARLGPRFHLVDALTENHVTPRGAVQPFTWSAFQRAD